MRILMFGWEFPPYNSGGLGVACQGLASALASRNNDVLFVLPKKLNVESRDLEFIFADQSGVEIAYINSPLMPYITSSKYLQLRGKTEDSGYGNTLFEEVLRYGALSREIAERETFDIVHAHDWLAYGAGIAAKDVAQVPLVAHIHATEIDRTAGNPDKYIFEREKEGFDIADKVISVSNYTREILSSYYDVSARKIEVVHNGIAMDNSIPSEKEVEKYQALKKAGYKVVIFVGRLTVMKGPDYFVKVAQRVASLNSKVLFVIAGSGDMEGQIIRQVAESGLSDKVLFAGFLRGEELSALYKTADLFVMPSVSEPFGLTALEALSHGTPILVSKQTGVSEVVRHAIKSDFWDVDDIADKILSVVEHDSLRGELKKNGHREVLGCDWGTAAEKCENIYNSLLQQ